MGDQPGFDGYRGGVSLKAQSVLAADSLLKDEQAGLMTDVFISYSRKDRNRAEVMARALAERGLDVWWDTHLKAGAEFRQEIAHKLEDAKAVIVIWSEESVASRFVCDEADVGAANDTLFPVLVDLVDIPLGFRQIQTADLTRWRGKSGDRHFQAFVDIIESVAGGRRTVSAPSSVVRQPMQDEPEPEPVAQPAAPVKPKKTRKPKASRSLMMTGQRARMTLIFQISHSCAAGCGGLLGTGHANRIYPWRVCELSDGRSRAPCLYHPLYDLPV